MTEHQETAEQLLHALRSWGVAFGELGRWFGVHHGMHATDATALVHIVGAEERGEPLSQSQLSRLVGLTPGATSSLLNRLEGAGHVKRLRDRVDRRVVTLRSTALMHREVEQFFSTASGELGSIMEGYSSEELARVVELLQQMADSLDRHLSGLRGR